MSENLEKSLPAVPRPFNKTLKGKSMLFLCALFACSLAIVLYVFDQKAKLLSQLRELEQVQEQGGALVEADLAAFSAITELFVIVDQPSREQVVARVHRQFSQLQDKYAQLLPLFPDRAASFKSMLQHLADTVMNPTAVSLAQLSQQLTQGKIELEQLLSENRSHRKKLLDQYLRRSDEVAWLSLMFGLMGLVLAGVTVALFFGHLSRDLLRLHHRVNQIVQGYRGEALSCDRDDEVGALICGVNEMAKKLSGREQELEIIRQKKFHQDKMGTIGHLAAGVVHEVRNPVAAILGLAEESRRSLQQWQSDQACEEVTGEKDSSSSELLPDLQQLAGNLDYIHRYADRLRLISDDLAAFNQPKVAEYEWIDLNQVVSNIENILGYDERWYGIELTTHLDDRLPAIKGVADQLSQVVLNLIENSFESMIGIDGRKSIVEVRTLPQAAEAGGIQLEVIDNGCGIKAKNLNRIFDAFYSTKGASRGGGLGMLLCHAIISGHGGSINVQSEFDAGTRVIVQLPIDSSDKRR